MQLSKRNVRRWCWPRRRKQISGRSNGWQSPTVILTPVLLHQCVRRAPVRKKPTHGRSTRWLSRPSIQYGRQPPLDGALLHPGSLASVSSDHERRAWPSRRSMRKTQPNRPAWHYIGTHQFSDLLCKREQGCIFLQLSKVVNLSKKWKSYYF